MGFASKSPWVIHYDASSCNGCDIEVLATLCPGFDGERFGVVNTGNPKHADIFLVTGSVNEQNIKVVQEIYDQMMEPKVVVACGICACSGGVFHDCYNVIGGVDKAIPVDVYAPGCAVRPEAIIDAIVQGVAVLDEKARALKEAKRGSVMAMTQFEQEFTPLAIDHIHDHARMRKQEGWRYVQTLAVNTDDGVDLIYSFMKDGVLENKLVRNIARDAVIPSITDVYLQAFVFENEIHDLFGIRIENIAIDFGGNFYQLAVKEPMTIISPEQQAAREKARKIAEAKAAKEAKAALAAAANTEYLSTHPEAKASEAGCKIIEPSESDVEAKLSGMDPEKIARVRAAMAAKAKKAAEQQAVEAAAAEAAKNAELEKKLANMDPEKAAKVRAALKAKAKKAAANAAEKEVSSVGKATVIPFGPQHPVLPEPLHLDLVVEDETVIDCIPQIGFVHRGLEKLVETRDYNQFIYIAERICGICAMGHSLGYAETVEGLMGVEVPKRAEYLRVIWHELSRIHSHLLWLGLAADAFGFESMFMHCWRLRERVLDIFEKTTGGRVILSVVKVGGVVRDIDATMLREIVNVLDGLRDDYTKIMNTLLTDTSIKNRTVGVGLVTHEQALDLSMVGPFARASNVAYDVRSFGRSAYGDLADFQPITATEGDCYARVKVRCLEVLQSIEIIKEIAAKMPEGDIAVKVKGSPAEGAQMSNVLEQPRGECYYYARGNGTKYLERMRMRTPTSQNLAGMTAALKGCDLADVNMIVLTIDPCISCTER